MTISVLNVLAQAYARSSGNRAASLIDEAVEGVAILNRIQRSCFSLAAQINPAFFGALYTNPASGGSWGKPPSAELTYYIETATSPREIVIVPYTERTVDVGLGRLYQIGSRYYSCGGTLDPGTTDTLNFLVSMMPTVLTTVNSLLDTSFPDEFVPLIVDETALHLALKDRRMDELPDLRRSRDSWLNLFVAHLQHNSGALVSRNQPWTPTVNPVQLIGSLFVQPPDA